MFDDVLAFEDSLRTRFDSVLHVRSKTTPESPGRTT
jgi:hypothetical protein